MYACRRLFLLAAGLVLVASAAVAATPAGPADAVRAHVARLKTLTAQAPADLDARLAAMARETYDGEEIATRAYGPRWQGLSAGRRAQALRRLDDLLVPTYVDAVKQFANAEVRVLDAAAPQGRYAEVSSEVGQGETVLPVSFCMVRRGSAWRLYDVRLFGLSMLESYAQELRAELENAG